MLNAALLSTSDSFEYITATGYGSGYAHKQKDICTLAKESANGLLACPPGVKEFERYFIDQNDNRLQNGKECTCTGKTVTGSEKNYYECETKAKARCERR